MTQDIVGGDIKSLCWALRKDIWALNKTKTIRLETMISKKVVKIASETCPGFLLS